MTVDSRMALLIQSEVAMKGAGEGERINILVRVRRVCRGAWHVSCCATRREIRSIEIQWLNLRWESIRVIAAVVGHLVCRL